MEKEKIIELGIDEEKAEKIMEIYSESVKNMVSKDELTAANKTISQLRETVKEFDGVDVEQLKKDISGWETKYNTDITNIKKNNAVDMAIVQAKGKNPKAIKALLDMDKIKLKDDGTLDGFDLEELKKSDGYLFDTEEKKYTGTGFEAGAGNKQNENDVFISAAMTAAGIKK